MVRRRGQVSRLRFLNRRQRRAYRQCQENIPDSPLSPPPEEKGCLERNMMPPPPSRSLSSSTSFPTPVFFPSLDFPFSRNPMSTNMSPKSSGLADTGSTTKHTMSSSLLVTSKDPEPLTSPLLAKEGCTSKSTMSSPSSRISSPLVASSVSKSPASPVPAHKEDICKSQSTTPSSSSRMLQSSSRVFESPITLPSTTKRCIPRTTRYPGASSPTIAALSSKKRPFNSSKIHKMDSSVSSRIPKSFSTVPEKGYEQRTTKPSSSSLAITSSSSYFKKPVKIHPVSALLRHSAEVREICSVSSKISKSFSSMSENQKTLPEEDVTRTKKSSSAPSSPLVITSSAKKPSSCKMPSKMDPREICSSVSNRTKNVKKGSKKSRERRLERRRLERVLRQLTNMQDDRQEKVPNRPATPQKVRSPLKTPAPIVYWPPMYKACSFPQPANKNEDIPKPQMPAKDQLSDEMSFQIPRLCFYTNSTSN